LLQGSDSDKHLMKAADIAVDTFGYHDRLSEDLVENAYGIRLHPGQSSNERPYERRNKRRRSPSPLSPPP
jgi:hypothetical protein